MTRSSTVRRGFTLTELAAVVVTSGLLVTTVLPALTGARKVNRTASCAANMGQLAAAMQAYQGDYGGYVPCAFVPEWASNSVGAWSEAAWGMPKRELWFYKLCPAYLKQPVQLICPQDPYADQFDFEAVDPNTGQPHSNTLVPSCGYGLNYSLRYMTAGNLQGTPPRWADRTILFSDIGPDGELAEAQLYYSTETSSVGQPWRDGGRMMWDDGARDWYAGPTWLTTRHGKGINMAAIDGSVRPARTLELIGKPLKASYLQCLRVQLPSREYVCRLCNSQIRHYDFSDSNFWWWTGPAAWDPSGAAAAAR